MKTKLILDVNKTQYAQLNSVVTGRVGDKSSNIVEVYAIDGGTPYNLTGLNVFFECVKPDNTVVRDDSGVKMIDAAKGHFEYTFPPETFGCSGKAKQAFFSIEKDEIVRSSTQDFVLVTLPDALTGRIPSESYISELDEIMKDATDIVERASGSPKGVFATLADLKAAFPKGDYGIYIVSADGKWYYWKDNTWTAGGVYQSTTLGEGEAGKNLNRGTLDPNQDLNDMTTGSSNGLWVISSANTNPNLPSTPKVAGMLQEWTTGKGDAVQVITWRSGGGTYEREHTGSSWRAWRRTDTIPSDTASRLNDLEFISGNGPFYRRPTLPDGTDLNTLRTNSSNGLHVIGSTQNYPNRPEGIGARVPGALMVFSTGNGDTYQQLFYRNKGGVFERYETSVGNFTPWVRIDGILTKLDGIESRISNVETVTDNGPFYRKPTLLEGTDFNSLRTRASNGLHLIGSTQSYPNRPEGIGARVPGALMVFSTGNGDTYQRVFYRNKGGVFERYETSVGNFTPWIRMDTFNPDDILTQLSTLESKNNKNEAHINLIEAQLTPKTTFEIKNVFTTFTEGEAYMDWIARMYPNKVTIITLGTTKRGLPLRAFRFGDPTKPTLYMMASQHGDEVMGREASMIFVRNLCESTNLGTLLADACIIILPVVNGDNINKTRTSSSGTDLNRNWGTRTTSEIQAAASVFSSYNVVLTIDSHEGGGIEYMEGLGPTAEGIAPGIIAVADDLHQTLTRAFTDANKPWRDYHGDAVTEIARNNIALTEHSVTYLFESPSLLETNMYVPSVTWRRDLYLLAYNTVIKHFHTNLNSYITAKESASKS